MVAVGLTESWSASVILCAAGCRRRLVTYNQVYELMTANRVDTGVGIEYRTVT